MPSGNGAYERPAQRLLSALLGTDETPYNSTDRSLYSRLKKYLGEPDTSLDPAPEVNALLSELVSHLQGNSKVLGLRHTSEFAAIEERVCEAIDKDELLQSRAAAIRSLAIRAESRLELFWTRALLDDGTVPEQSLSATEKVVLGAGDFPYTMNYVSMVEKEVEVINTVLQAMPELDGNLLVEDDSGRRKCIEVAFCGSGPLPLTGILMAASMDAMVTLVDIDYEAAQLSRRLVANWEARGIIAGGQVRVVCADGGKVDFCRRAARHAGRAGPRVSVQCDVLFVAALIPNSTKEEIAQNVSEMRAGGPLVVLRTAHGLTARLAYFQNRRHVMAKHLEFVGLVAPKVHEVGGGWIVDDNVRPIGFFDEKILNSLELYRWRGNHAIPGTGGTDEASS